MPWRRALCRLELRCRNARARLCCSSHRFFFGFFRPGAEPQQSPGGAQSSLSIHRARLQGEKAESARHLKAAVPLVPAARGAQALLAVLRAAPEAARHCCLWQESRMAGHVPAPAASRGTSTSSAAAQSGMLLCSLPSPKSPYPSCAKKTGTHRTPPAAGRKAAPKPCPRPSPGPRPIHAAAAPKHFPIRTGHHLQRSLEEKQTTN